MPNERVPAIILAGGAGTRIAPVLGDLPKALAPVHGRPFLAYLLDQLADSGCIDRIVIAAGHGAEQVAEFIAGGNWKHQVELSREHEPLGTGGALIQAVSMAASETVVVLNGDSFVDLDLDAFLHAHRDADAVATVAAVRVADAGRYGTLMLDGARVTGFMEKSHIAAPAWINAGVYAFERRVLAEFSPAPCSLERDILPGLLAQTVGCHKLDGRFIDIGTPASYDAAEEVLRKP